MGSFKNIIDTGVLDARYANKVLVFVESDEDLQVLQNRWFFEEKEWLEFRSSDEGHGGGCTQVMAKVTRYREKNVTVFGIVDRDSLMKCNEWSSFWETDDQVFKNARPFGPFVRVLCRWELENYLLDPEGLEYILADCSKEAPRERRKKIQVIRELLEVCHILMPVMAANVLFHENSTEALTMGFGLSFRNRGELESEIEQQIMRNFQNQGQYQSSLEQYKNHLARVVAFAGSHPEGSEEKWLSLNRIIDGKRILKRLQHQYNLTEKLKYDLASRIKLGGRIDPEIKALVVSFKSLRDPLN